MIMKLVFFNNVLQYEWVKKMKCLRCLNEDPRYFYNYQGHYYCRKCIGFGKSQVITKTQMISHRVDYHLGYELTPLQKKISKELVKRYQEHRNTTLKAVCGAGKTEMMYEVIRYALNSGHLVCFATPRKELVIELSNRFKRQFLNIEPVVVYGGHCQKTDGQFIICTTHQLYRYRNFFDLLILDEYDAFPYYHNEVLENMLKTSIKGCYIFMSATIEKGDIDILSRYHQYPVPVPKCLIGNVWMNILRMLLKVRKYQQANKPVLIFVPTIMLTKRISRYLRLCCVPHAIATSKTSHIHELIDRLVKHRLAAIVCTTVLERGITIPDIQIMVIYGEHRVFSKETLIQIAGRAGRIQPYVDGEVTIFAARKTKAINACIKQLKQDNALSVTVI